MTIQHISHDPQEQETRQGMRSAFSPGSVPGVAGDKPTASQPIRRFDEDFLRVSRTGVAIAPASIAGLVLACVSVAACRHAASQPLQDLRERSSAAGRVDVHHAVTLPAASTRKKGNPPSRTAGTHAAGKARAGALVEMNTPSYALNEPVAASSSAVAFDVPASTSSSARAVDDSALSASTELPQNGAPSPTTTAVETPRTMATTLPLPHATPSWVTKWVVPGAATVIASLALWAALARRRRARKNASAQSQGVVVGWKDWRYRTSLHSSEEFFGADQPEQHQAWAVDQVRVDGWTDGEALKMKPATDARYGLMKPVRPPRIDLSLDDDPFLHWASSTQDVWRINVPRDVREDVIAPAGELPRAEDYDDTSSLIDDVAMAQAAVSDPIAPLQSAPEVMPPQEAVTHDANQHALREEAERHAAMAREREETARREAMERERQEAARHETMEREQREATRLEAERVEAERQKAEHRLTQEREAQWRAAMEAKAQHEESVRQSAVTEAKKRLTAGYPKKALEELALALAVPHASGEAWTVAGWCWWRMARDNGPETAKAVEQAVHAFHRAIAAEPDREAMLGSALIRCHLFMADHLQGSDRAESLDAALRLLDSARSNRQGGDARFVLEYAGVLYERAMLSSPEHRASQLEQAQQLLSNMPAKEVDADARWLMVTIWLAQANQAQGRAADTLLARAADTLTQVPADATSETRDNWLARLIDVELLRLRDLKAAARLMCLRQLRDTYVPKLSEARSILPLLSWIKVLREWADMLSERPAREKFEEAESLFERIESLLPDDMGAIQFARAYYLRLRAAREPTAAALDTLDKADTLLAHAQSAALSAEVILLGRAEIALARAPLLDSRERRLALEQAVRFSDASVTTEDGNLPRALVCGIAARLAAYEMSAPSTTESNELIALARRLHSVMPYDPEALRLSARCAFIASHFATAGQLCETAWDAGCRDAELLRLWRDSLVRQPNVQTNAANDPQWKRLNHCTRLAQSIGQATR